MSSRRTKNTTTTTTLVQPPPPLPPSTPPAPTIDTVRNRTANRRQQRSVSRSRQRETQLLPPIRSEYMDEDEDTNNNDDDNASQVSVEALTTSMLHRPVPTTSTTTSVHHHHSTHREPTSSSSTNIAERSFQPVGGSSSSNSTVSRGLTRRPSTEGSYLQHSSTTNYASRGSGTVALSSYSDTHHPPSLASSSSAHHHPSTTNTTTGFRVPSLGITLPSFRSSNETTNTNNSLTSPHLYATDAHVYTSPNGTMHMSHHQSSPRPPSPSSASYNSSSYLFGSSSSSSHFNRPLTIPPRPSWLLLKLQTPMGIIVGGLLIALSSLFLFALIHRTRALGGGLSAVADAFVDVTGFSGMAVSSYVPNRVRGALGLETGLDHYHTSISRTILQVNDTVYEVPIDWDLRSKLIELVIRLRNAENALIQQHAVLSVEADKLSNIAGESDIARQRALLSADEAMAKTNATITDAQAQLIQLKKELTANLDQAIIAEAEKLSVSFQSLHHGINSTEQHLKSVEEIASKAEAQAKHNTYDLISNVSPRLQKLENQTINVEEDIVTLKKKGTEYAQLITKLTTDLTNLDKAYKGLQPITEANKKDIQKIQEQIKTIETLEKTITNDITGLQNRTTNLAEHTKRLDEQISNITTAAGTLETKLRTFQDSVGNQFTEVNKQAKTAAASIDELRNKNKEFLQSLDGLSKTLTVIDTKLQTKVDETTFKDFDTQVSQRFNETLNLLAEVSHRLVTVHTNLSKFIEDSVQAVENRMRTNMDALSTTLNHNLDTFKETTGLEFDTVKTVITDNYHESTHNYTALTVTLQTMNQTIYASLLSESSQLANQLNQFHQANQQYTEKLVNDLSSSILRTVGNLNTTLHKFDERTQFDMTEFTDMVTNDVQRLNSSYILRLQNMNMTLNRALERLYELEVALGKHNSLPPTKTSNEPLYQNVKEVKNDVDRYTELFQTFQNFTTRIDESLDTRIGTTLDRLTEEMDSIRQSFESYSTRSNEKIDNVNNALRAEIETLKQTMETNDNAISTGTSANFEIVQSSLYSLLNKLQDMNTTLSTAVPDLIRQSQTDIQGTMDNGLNDIYTRLEEFYRTVRYIGQAVGIEQIQETINALNEVVNSNENEEDRIFPQPVALPTLIDNLNTTTYAFMQSLQNQINNLQLVYGSSDNTNSQLLTDYSNNLEQIKDAFTTFRDTTNGNYNTVNNRIDELNGLVQTLHTAVHDNIPAEFERLRTVMEGKMDTTVILDQMASLNTIFQTLTERVTTLEQNLYRIDTPLLSYLVASYNASLHAQRGMDDDQGTAALSRIVSQLSGTSLRKDNDMTSSSIRHVWPDGTQKDGLAALLAETNEDSSLNRVALLSDITSLLDKVLATTTADTIALPDYALAAGGAWIINETHFTSDTWHPDRLPHHHHHHSNSLLSLAAHHARTTFTALVTGTPYAALTADTSVGSCWPMVGTKGVLSVHLAAPIMVMAVTIDHLPRELKMGRTPTNAAISASALKRFSVYGLKGNTTNDLQSKVLLGSFTYDAIHGPVTQTFHFHPSGAVPVPRATPLSSEYPIIQLEIQDNYGNPNFTCLYRFRVHGYPIGNLVPSDGAIYFTKSNGNSQSGGGSSGNGDSNGGSTNSFSNGNTHERGTAAPPQGL